MTTGRELEPGGGSLGRLARIDPVRPAPRARRRRGRGRLRRHQPALRPEGASAVYGPQKGATPADGRGARPQPRAFRRDRRARPGRRDPRPPGSGAAGGLGGGLVAFAGGRLEPGIKLVIEAVNLAGRLENADLCLTGEGALDAQSAFGKTAVGVARLARSLGCPVLALAGSIGPGAEAVLDQGIDAYFSICPGPIGLDQAIGHARRAARSRRPSRPCGRSWRRTVSDPS